VVEVAFALQVNDALLALGSVGGFLRRFGRSHAEFGTAFWLHRG
jgi:hypothetical protein